MAITAAGLSLTVYVLTLAPGLTFEHWGADGGDLITAARTLGIPHPTGYPTYTLLAWLFSQMPIGPIAYRVNLLSAVCAAAATGLLCDTAQVLLPGQKERKVLALATALTFAFSSLLWSQAVISEVYALLTLFAALLLWLLVRWREGGNNRIDANLWRLKSRFKRPSSGCPLKAPKARLELAPMGNNRLLWLAAFLFGLGLGNHLTLAFLAPAVPVLLWPERRRWLRPQLLLPAAGLCALGLGIYAYLPLAAAHRPAVNWGNPQTWRQFLWVVTGKQYQPFVFGLPPDQALPRLGSWALLLGDQFGWWGLAIALAGAAWTWQHDRPLALMALTWSLPLAIYAFFYNTGDSYIYLLPAVMLLALGWGAGGCYLLHLARRLKPPWQRTVLVALALLPLVSLALHWQAADLSDDRSVQTYTHQVLEAVAPNSLVVVRGDRATFSLWYAIYAEGRRPDVAVVNGPMLAFIWYREHMRHLYPDLILEEPSAARVTTDDLVRELMAANSIRRPVYATDPSDAWREWFDFLQAEGTPVFRVQIKSRWGSGE